MRSLARCFTTLGSSAGQSTEGVVLAFGAYDGSIDIVLASPNAVPNAAWVNANLTLDEAIKLSQALAEFLEDF